MGMRSQVDRVHLVRSLILYPHIDDILGEHVTLEQVGVIVLECVQGFRQ